MNILSHARMSKNHMKILRMYIVNECESSEYIQDLYREWVIWIYYRTHEWVISHTRRVWVIWICWGFILWMSHMKILSHTRMSHITHTKSVSHMNMLRIYIVNESYEDIIAHPNEYEPNKYISDLFCEWVTWRYYHTHEWVSVNKYIYDSYCAWVIWIYTYGVATISRPLNIISLFCRI